MPPSPVGGRNDRNCPAASPFSPCQPSKITPGSEVWLRFSGFVRPRLGFAYSSVTGNPIVDPRDPFAALFTFLSVARGLRILQGFAGICRVKWFIFFSPNSRCRTLDQHIGVRIPGGQPIEFTPLMPGSALLTILGTFLLLRLIPTIHEAALR
jgi:hypothetical protein